MASEINNKTELNTNISQLSGKSTATASERGSLAATIKVEVQPAVDAVSVEITHPEKLVDPSKLETSSAADKLKTLGQIASRIRELLIGLDNNSFSPFEETRANQELGVLTKQLSTIVGQNQPAEPKKLVSSATANVDKPPREDLLSAIKRASKLVSELTNDSTSFEDAHGFEVVKSYRLLAQLAL